MDWQQFWLDTNVISFTLYLCLQSWHQRHNSLQIHLFPEENKLSMLRLYIKFNIV